jgi:hypothetical protein
MCKCPWALANDVASGVDGTAIASIDMLSTEHSLPADRKVGTAGVPT